jgi:hypothetical protein
MPDILLLCSCCKRGVWLRDTQSVCRGVVADPHGVSVSGAEHLYVLEANGENRDILLAHVHKMADQLGETEACEFANVMHGIMLGKPVGVVLMTPTGVQSAPLDPARVYQQSDSIRITPVDYKLKFCIDQAARYVFVSFGDLSCTSGLAASWRIGLDGALEVIDYVLIGAGFSAVAHAAL